MIYLTLGVDFCVYGCFLYRHLGSHTPTSRSFKEVWENRKANGDVDKGKKIVLREKREQTGKRNPLTT